MNHMKTNKTSRRKFLSSASAIAIGSVAFGFDLPDTSSQKKSKEEIFKQLDELVDKYLPVFGTCSQTSFHALNETFNLKADKIVNALASFPGIAFRGETCGAVSGSLLAIALVYEEDNPAIKPNQRLSRTPSINFCSKFESEFGTTRCRDVIAHTTGKAYSISKPEDYELLSRDGVYRHCPGVIKKALHDAAEIILEKA
jgi:C_GCAxxG_C_C family probable redox protein